MRTVSNPVAGRPTRKAYDPGETCAGYFQAWIDDGKNRCGSEGTMSRWSSVRGDPLLGVLSQDDLSARVFHIRGQSAAPISVCP